MKVLFIQPLKAPKTVEIDGSLESMQKLVGGYIESIYPFEDGEICLVCNEEGKLEGLPLAFTTSSQLETKLPNKKSELPLGIKF